MNIVLDQDVLKALGAALVLSVVMAYMAYRQGYYSLAKESKNLPLVDVSFGECLGAFLAFVVAQVAIVPIGIFTLLAINYGTSFPRLDDLPLSLKAWINVLSIISGGIFLILYVLAVKEKDFKLFFGKKSLALSNLGFGILSWIVSYPGFFLLSLALSSFFKVVFGVHPEEQVAIKHLKSTFEYPLPFSLTLIALLTVVPVTEELLFRGFLQNALRKKLGIKASIAIASLVFALFHFSFSQGIYNLELLPLLFYLSCYLGFCYERQKSLWAPIGLHALFNLFNVVFIVQSTTSKGL